MDFADAVNKALKYGAGRDRLPVSAIHPELRFTRLGAVLREHATEPGDVGELAYQALTGDHSQPLELMPLHLLKDKMQEEPDHPMASRFNWNNVPGGVALDRTTRDAFGNEIHNRVVNPVLQHDRLTGEHRRALRLIADTHPESSPEERDDSLKRVTTQQRLMRQWEMAAATAALGPHPFGPPPVGRPPRTGNPHLGPFDPERFPGNNDETWHTDRGVNDELVSHPPSAAYRSRDDIRPLTDDGPDSIDHNNTKL